MSDSKLKKPKALVPWLRYSKVNGIASSPLGFKGRKTDGRGFLFHIPNSALYFIPSPRKTAIDNAYYPDGDPEGDDGYPGSIFGIGHDQTQYVSEISIPVPVASRDLEAAARGFDRPATS